jgi:hypothetical protein
MKPGPDLIVACPSCGRRAKVPSLRSGNTFDARFWTDGKVDAPMLPRRPPIAPCKGCRRVFWWHDVVVGESSSGYIIAIFVSLLYGIPLLAYLGVPRMILITIGVVGPLLAVGLAVRRHVQIVETPSEEHFLNALSDGLGKDRDREMALRLHAWWAANDAMRAALTAAKSAGLAKPDPPRRTDAQSENLKRLFELLDPAAPEERLLKAEAARELGDFDGAAALLEGEIPDDQAEIAARIRQLTEERASLVAEIRFSTPDASEERGARASR